MLRYVDDNPKRAMTKRQNPELFKVVRELRVKTMQSRCTEQNQQSSCTEQNPQPSCTAPTSRIHRLLSLNELGSFTIAFPHKTPIIPNYVKRL